MAKVPPQFLKNQKGAAATKGAPAKAAPAAAKKGAKKK